MPQLQICYHDHCFDGVASAATFLRFYGEKVKPGLEPARVAFKGMAHRPGQLFGEDVFAGEENAVVDFRFTPDPRLTWWFDHHQSAFGSPADEAVFRADRSGRKHWDPAAKSCTRFLSRVAQERFGWDPTALSELIEWAEVIDGAQFPDPQTAVELTHPAMQLMLLIEATKDAQLGPRLIRQLSERPLSEVLRERWVTDPLSPLLARHREIVRTVTERMRVDKGVAEYDLADLGADVVQVEPPGGSPARAVPPLARDGAGSFVWDTYAANKRGVVCDLGTEDGRSGLRALASRADMLIESPGPVGMFLIDRAAWTAQPHLSSG